jgi:hypothetical membrane protein
MDITTIRRVETDKTRIAGLLFFVLAGQFLTVVMLAASIAPGYDNNAGAISDLGVIPSTALLFNAALLIVGALNIVGGWLFFAAHRRSWLLLLYLVAGVGAIGAGIFPLDRGGLHSLFALVAFLFFNLEALGTAAVVRGVMRWISVLAGAAGLLFVVVMIIGDGGNTQVFGAIGHGGAERMIVYPAMLWMLGLAGFLMSGRRGAATGDPGASA